MIKRPIYYQYLEINKFNKIFHLISLDEEGLSFMIPDVYEIDYSKSFNDYKDSGHINFTKDNKKFFLEFTKKDYNNFKLLFDKDSNHIKKNFTNYQNKEFVEVKRDNIDYIYMYYNDYEYKLYSNGKLTLNEYFDMYFIFFSIIEHDIYRNIKLIEDLVYFNEQAIDKYYNDIDILLVDLKEYNLDYVIKEDLILIKDDKKFLDYKKILLKVEDINSDNFITINIDGDLCFYSGVLNFYSFGKYNKGIMKEYDEIVCSDELKLDEKTSLIKNLLKQKQTEISLSKEILKENLLNEVYKFIKINVDYEKWNQFHLVEFIDDNIKDNLMNYKKVYEYFTNNLNSYEEFIKIINEDSILKSICGQEIEIYPEYYVIKFSGLNKFIFKKEIILNENFSITHKKNMI